MTSRTITNDYEHRQLIKYLEGKKRPFTVEITDKRKRSTEQNALQHLWLSQLVSQMGDRTREELRAEVKLMFGVPILRAENERFRAVYDRLIKHLSYEDKVEAIMALDLPVTRLMTVEQKSRFLDDMSRYFIGKGYVLTDPTVKEAA